MKPYIRLSLILLAVLAVCASCNKEMPEDVPHIPEEMDEYIGDMKSFRLGLETRDLKEKHIRFHIMTENGKKIVRSCVHKRSGEWSDFTLNTGLKEGIYRLLYLEYDLKEPICDGKITTGILGLGSRINITKSSVSLMDSYNSEMGFAGSGTEMDPYMITSADHLQRLANITNNSLTNHKITTETHFKQDGDINMERVSWEFADGYGWYPIGFSNILPFRGKYNGGGNRLTGMFSYRDNSFGIGLFGFLQNAQIDSVIIEDAEIYGLYATGAIAGAAVTDAGKRDFSVINHCKVINSIISGSQDSVEDVDTRSMSVGGLIGAVDQYAKLSIHGCSIDSDSEVKGGYGVGGILGTGNLFSSIEITDCENQAPIRCAYSATGGIAGSADTITFVGCVNRGNITGSEKYIEGDKTNAGISAGGIIGGAGVSSMTTCTNTANVSGNNGVGGIIGSTRVGDSNEYFYNTAALRYCSNSGKISGKDYVGGICGEAQFSGYNICNTGEISGSKYVAGISGCSSVSAIMDALNSGKVTGNEYTAGIIGRSTWGTFVNNQNYGNITSNGNYCAGIISLAGDNTTIHYCENAGALTSKGTEPRIGGIVGEIGDPTEWEASTIAGITVGLLEMILPIISVPAVAVIQEGKVWIGVTASIVGGMITLPTDIVFNGLGIDSILNNYELSTIQDDIGKIVTKIQSDITDDIDSLRLAHTRWDDYHTHMKDFSDYCAGNEGNNTTTVMDALNTMRFDRSEEVNADRQQKELTHTILGGCCIVIGAIATILSAIPTGGGSIMAGISVAGTVIGTTTAVVGGLNGVVQGATYSEDNTVIISQCINSGFITTTNAGHSSTSYVGGIAGRLHDYCLLKDCAGTDNYSGSNTANGALVGKVGKKCELYDSHVIGSLITWEGLVASYDNAYSHTSKGLYYTNLGKETISLIFANDGDDLNTSICGKEESYSGWSIGDSDKKWKMQEETEPDYPIPFRSETILGK